MTRATASVLEEVLLVVQSLEAKVGSLTAVVSRLETLITKQNTVIEEQQNIVARLCGKITEIAVTARIERQTTNVPTSAPTQTESYASQTRKKSVTKKHLPRKPAIPSPAVDIITQARKSGQPDHASQPIIINEEKPSQQLSASSEAPWKTQRRKERRSATTIGLRADTNLQAVVKRRFIHAWRFSKETTAEQLKSYLESVIPDTVIEVIILKNKGHYASFRVGVAEEDFNKFINPEIWPIGISIGKYIFFFSSKNRL